MASSGKKGKKSKGKTLPLTEFLGDGPTLPPPMPRKSNWADADMDDVDPLPAVQMYLPTAPRAARGSEFDEARIPKNGPYVAYISNLVYDIEEKELADYFQGLDLEVTNVRLPHDDRTGKQKGFGYVEFADKNSFLTALQIIDPAYKGRRMRIDIADNNDGSNNRRGGMRDRDNYGEERTSGDWRSGPRQDLSDDRRGPRRDYGGGGFRDSMDRDRGSNVERDTGGNWRDAPRRQLDDRDDRNGSSFGGPRRNFGDRDRMRNGSPPPPDRVRPKLDLKPRTLPIEPIQVREVEPKDEDSAPAAPRPAPSKPSAASIFGGAKPVDTAAREREIEERLARSRQTDGNEPPLSRSEPRERSAGRKEASDPPPPENAWAKRSQRNDDATAPAQENTETRREVDETPRVAEQPPRETRERDQTDSSRDRDRSDKYVPPRPRDSERSSRPYKDDHGSYRDRGSYRDERGSYRNSDRGSYRDSDDRNGDRERGSYRDSDRDRGSHRDYDRDRGSYRDSDRDRGSNRDYDRDRGSYRDSDRGSYRDSDRDRGSYRDSDRDRGSYRDSDRDRGTYKERDDRSKDYDRDRDREPEKDNRERPRDSDRERERERRDENDKEKESESRGGSGSRSSGQPESKGTSKEQRPPREMPKVPEPVAPNYVAENKFSFLEDDE